MPIRVDRSPKQPGFYKCPTKHGVANTDSVVGEVFLDAWRPLWYYVWCRGAVSQGVKTVVPDVASLLVNLHLRRAKDYYRSVRKYADRSHIPVTSKRSLHLRTQQLDLTHEPTNPAKPSQAKPSQAKPSQAKPSQPNDALRQNGTAYCIAQYIM